MLTDRDITICAVAEGLSPTDTAVQEVMTTEVEYIFEDYPVEAAARFMSELQVRRLPVVDRDHRLVCIVSLGDVSLSEQHSAGDCFMLYFTTYRSRRLSDLNAGHSFRVRG